MSARDAIFATAAGLLDPQADAQKIVDTVLAAGVAAALGTGARVFAEDRRFGERPSLLGGSVLPLVPWSDPVPWMRQRPGDASWAADAWQIAATSWPGIRILLGPADEDLELTRDLAGGTAVASVVHSAEMASPAEIPRWSWPLRLSLARPGGPWTGGPPDADLWHGLSAAARSRAGLITPVDTSGRWSRTSLLIRAGSGSDDAGDCGPVHATAVIALTDPPGITGSGLALRGLGARHRAAVAAAAAPGSSPRRWLEALLTSLSEDYPLDVALWRAAGASGTPTPVIVADPRYLDSTRIRPVLAAATSGALSPAEQIRIGRNLRGGPRVRDASPVLDPAEGLRVAAHRAQRIAARFLRADVVEPDGITVSERIEPDREFHVLVRIMADPGAHEWESPFPADALPPGPTHQLTVLATDLAPAAGSEHTVRQAAIELPGDADSSAAVLRFRAGASGDDVEIGIAVLYGARFLQTGVLTGRAGAAQPPVFRVDAVIRASTLDLDLSPSHDAAVFVGHSAAGTAVLTAQLGRHVRVHEPGNLPGTVAVLLDGLRQLTFETYQPGGYQDPKFATLLIELARRGRALRKTLFPERDWTADGFVSELRAARRVSVLSAKPGAFLPVELLYDRPLATGPGQKLRLCPHAPARPDQPGCAGCPEREDSAVVCPFGFWGTSKVIERHVCSELTDPRYALAVSPSIDRHACGLQPVCAAASGRADHNDAAVWSKAAEELAAEPAAAVRFATDWAGLYQAVTTARSGRTPPGVIFLVPHSRVNDAGIGVLSLGENDEREITDGLEFLFAGDGRPEPVVFVLGCTTAGGSTLFSDTSAMLLNDGAPGVVATLVPVLGRHIVPVGVRLLRELLAQAAKPDGPALGEALLRARRQLLADGDACVLALAGFGDTDWQVRTALS